MMKLSERMRELKDEDSAWALTIGLVLIWADEVAQLESENAVLRNTISLLKNENERMMKLAHDYITAYEKLAFGEEQE